MKQCPKLPSTFEEQEMPHINHIGQKLGMTAKVQFVKYGQHVKYYYI